MSESTMKTFVAVPFVHENVEKSIRRAWSNRGMNGWWLNTDRRINVEYKMFPEICFIIGDRCRPETMAKITGAMSTIHAIATYEMNVALPLGVKR